MKYVIVVFDRFGQVASQIKDWATCDNYRIIRDLLLKIERTCTFDLMVLNKDNDGDLIKGYVEAKRGYDHALLVTDSSNMLAGAMNDAFITFMPRSRQATHFTDPLIDVRTKFDYDRPSELLAEVYKYLLDVLYGHVQYATDEVSLAKKQEILRGVVI